MSFTTLQVTSAYSLLKSTIRIEEYIALGRRLGYDQLVLTDEGVMHAAIEFYEKCQKAGMKPIIGCQFAYHPFEDPEKTATMMVYAADAEGYQLLLQLSTWYQLDKSVSKRMKDCLKAAGAHLQVVFAQSESEWASFTEKEKFDVWLSAMCEQYPSCPFGLGIESASELPMSLDVLAEWSGSRVFLLPFVKAYYLHPDDHFSWKVLGAIDEGKVVHRDDLILSGVHYLHASAELEERFAPFLDGRLVRNLEAFTASLVVSIPLHQQLLPKFVVPDGVTGDVYLRQLCEDALARLGKFGTGSSAKEGTLGQTAEGSLPVSSGAESEVSLGLVAEGASDAESSRSALELEAVYRKRLGYELDVIHQMGFDDYFLIVWDIMRYAHEVGIQTGPGRGSAAGSLVAYLLKITQVDPIEYDLLFERFLNPERQTMPDIDLDFPDNKREMLLAYVAEKYGPAHVAQIATFGTLAAKQSLRDVSRALGRTPAQAGEWSRVVPNTLGIKLDEAFRQSKGLRELVQSSTMHKIIFDTARRLEGLPRHLSTHAAGVVISDRPLVDYVPLVYRDDIMPTTQYSMSYVERIGLLKMDFLGLTNLSVLHDAIEATKKVYQVDLDIETIPLDDDATYALFREARTNGIFQFESSGIRRVLKKLIPESLADLTAVNALYRPGPMEQIDTFIKRKHGQESITYPHPILEEVLKPTYGVMVYQEQVMQVASRLSGYTLGEADILRRAIGKKNAKVIEEERRHFVEGALKQGVTSEVASQVYDYIERFANYGFNKSHALAYSLLAYQLAYLKVHYPIAFYTGIFASIGERSTKRQEYFSEAREQGIVIHAPNINTSLANYSGEADGIYIGLSAIKGLRRDFVMQIIQERYQNGPYEDFMDFAFRMGSRFCKEEPLLALIDSGAFDVFGKNRATLRATVPAVVESVKFHGGMIPMILVDDLYPKYFNREEDDVLAIVDREMDVLGFPLSAFPTDHYEKLYEKNRFSRISSVFESQVVSVLGILKDIRKIRTKRGQPMAFAKLQDTSGTIDLAIFPEAFPRVLRQLEEHSLVGVRGKVTLNREGNQQIQVSDMDTQARLDRMLDEASTRIYIKITKDFEARENFQKISEIARLNPGDSDVFFYLESRSQLIKAKWMTGIAASEDALGALKRLLGDENVKKIK